MKKEFKNFTIENLTKTDWINQFNKIQQEEIMLGLEKGLDISWYAKPEFNLYQMKQIRLGLLNNIDVSIYAKKELNWKKMREIREELLKESTL